MIALHIAYTGFRWALVVLVLVGAVPMLAASYQYLLVTLHFQRNHYRDVAPNFPRTAILVPAWNEAAVIGAELRGAEMKCDKTEKTGKVAMPA